MEVGVLNRTRARDHRHHRDVRVIHILLLVLTFTLMACERGCLTRRAGERGGGGRAPEGSGQSTPDGRGWDLGGVDCSDGLLRCVEGRIEASRLAHLPYPCKSTNPERADCTCPWAATEHRCPLGCLEDGLEVVGG